MLFRSDRFDVIQNLANKLNNEKVKVSKTYEEFVQERFDEAHGNSSLGGCINVNIDFLLAMQTNQITDLNMFVISEDDNNFLVKSIPDFIERSLKFNDVGDFINQDQGSMLALNNVIDKDSSSQMA